MYGEPEASCRLRATFGKFTKLQIGNLTPANTRSREHPGRIESRTGIWTRTAQT